MTGKKPENFDRTPDESLVEGRNAVLEALRAGRTIDKIYILRGAHDASLGEILARAKRAGIVVVESERAKLDAMSMTGVHQGVIAACAAHEYADFDALLEKAKEKDGPALFVLCDGITDPHNLGAIIRTAGAVGADGVIIPKRRSVALTAVVAKAAAGALEYVPVARVGNLTNAIEKLKDAGIWIYGTSDRAEKSLYQTDLRGNAAFVVGSEGEGMSRLVEENCDFVLSIPMAGRIASLNASNAAAVVLFEAVRQRTVEN
ncbi:MAG: 23S rRNA (guanosine(2251)-2'-O)-methyltransferase RlmB [Oscillospiraceae bacterium]|nr:23S rRNA (guanosine(2251)-2'-O)-methyltransferase RlmB [Oscillospiraceae bacterium]